MYWQLRKVENCHRNPQSTTTRASTLPAVGRV